MKRCNLAIHLLALIVIASCAMRAQAQEPADRSLSGDAVCTRCHDESEANPVLSIYKTRHGVKADARTPGCQSCHGASAAHVKNPQGTSTRPLVDIDFGARSGTPVETQAGTCLSCQTRGVLHLPPNAARADTSHFNPPDRSGPDRLLRLS
jgi:hypothetical protein